MVRQRSVTCDFKSLGRWVGSLGERGMEGEGRVGYRWWMPVARGREQVWQLSGEAHPLISALPRNVRDPVKPRLPEGLKAKSDYEIRILVHEKVKVQTTHSISLKTFPLKQFAGFGTNALGIKNVIDRLKNISILEGWIWLVSLRQSKTQRLKFVTCLWSRAPPSSSLFRNSMWL